MHGFIVNIVRYSGIPPIVIFIPLFKSSSECLYQEGTYYGYKRTHAQTFGSGVVYAFFFFKKVIGEFQGVVRASFFKEICGLLAGLNLPNNSVKHPETVQELYYSMRHCLPPAVPFQNDVRN